MSNRSTRWILMCGCGQNANVFAFCGRVQCFQWMKARPGKLIRKHLTEIDADSGLTKDDKKLLKRFYLENCLPPRIQDVIRKFFPDEFAGNDRQGIKKTRAKTGDHTASDGGPPNRAESEPE